METEVTRGHGQSQAASRPVWLQSGRPPRPDVPCPGRCEQAGGYPVSQFRFWRVYFYTLPAFFTEMFGEWTKEVSYRQEEIDDSCWGRRRGKPFQVTKTPFFAPEEVTECITGEKWILRGHMDNSLTFEEDTLLSEKMTQKLPYRTQWGGLGCLCCTEPKSIGFVRLTTCPVWSGLSKYFNCLGECPKNPLEWADLVPGPLLTSCKGL